METRFSGEEPYPTYGDLVLHTGSRITLHSHADEATHRYDDGTEWFGHAG